MFYALQVFPLQFYLVLFLWSLKDSKSPQVSKTLLSILVDLNNAVFSMVSIFFLIYNFSSIFSKPLETVSTIPTRIIITVNFTFNNSLAL